MSALPPPEIRLKEVLHETPFEHFVCDKMGPGREYFDTLVVKGTFSIVQRGRAEVAHAQLPIALATSYGTLTTQSARRCVRPAR